MASTIQQRITNLEETIVFLKSLLPIEEVVKPVKADKKKVEKKEEKVVEIKEPVEKKASVKKPVEKKADAKVTVKKAEAKEKNLNRMTPAVKTELAKVLKTSNIELTEELRKEFIEVVNSMESDAYAASNLTAHMESFAKSKTGGADVADESVVEVEEDADEDLEEISFKKKTYVVGLRTKRVYEPTDDKDTFVGFLGIGEFKDMKFEL